MKTLNVVLCLCLSSLAYSATKVGNADDGSDLEGAKPITSGAVINARQKAIDLISELNVKGIRGLGQLPPEVSTSQLYMASTDVSASLNEDLGAFHSDTRGKVFARTLAEAHAATRFFPIVQTLNQDQLMALHIHEALHRALPPEIRQDEAKVSRLTLGITAPGASHDSVLLVSKEVLPEEEYIGHGMPVVHKEEIEHLPNPNSVGYELRNYLTDDARPSRYPISRMHLVHSYLYPFGDINTPFGMGIAASLVERPVGAQMGPLELSARLRVWSRRGFDVGIWGTASLNTLSAEELKSSPFGRDVYTLGISMRKDLKHFYVENYTSVGLGGEANQIVGRQTYKYDYGEVYNVKIRAGTKIGRFDLGAFAELHLSDHFRVSGGSFSYDPGRFRILSAGPEVRFNTDTLFVVVNGRLLVDGTREASFDWLGNLMGPGTSQGSIGASAGVIF